MLVCKRKTKTKVIKHRKIIPEELINYRRSERLILINPVIVNRSNEDEKNGILEYNHLSTYSDMGTKIKQYFGFD